MPSGRASLTTLSFSSYIFPLIIDPSLRKTVSADRIDEAVIKMNAAKDVSLVLMIFYPSIYNKEPPDDVINLTWRANLEKENKQYIWCNFFLVIKKFF